MPLAPGTLLNNRYRIVSILGQGGMGAVYRASDEHLVIPVAVKENLFLTEEYGRQFQREAHILAGLRHPNLPHVSDYFAMENQGQYLVMDYVEGEDLRQRMERIGAIPEREAVLIGISICDALTYLHSRRAPIVHRDIKPGNIKVTPDGQAVLVDFGLAKIMQGSQATSTGARAMTPGYSPPEQYGTARTDPRSDIYSLGATLYAALTGIIPEDGLARMTGKARLTPIRDLSPKINRKLAESIEHALEVDPDDRYQSADEFKEALIESGELAPYYQDRPAISPPPPPSAPSNSSEDNAGEIDMAQERVLPYSSRSRRRRRNQTNWIFGLLVAIVAVVAFALFAMRNDLGQTVQAIIKPGSAASGEVAPTNTFQPGETNSSGAQTPTVQNLSSTNIQETANAQLGLMLTLTPDQTQQPLATPTITPTITGGGRGQIAFASDRTGVMEIWLIDTNNPQKPRQITGTNNPSSGACQPTWSPDGMRLAYISPCPGKQDSYPGSNIYTMDVDASGKPVRGSETQLTSSLEGDYDPAWSPDGKRIAFTSLRGGKPAIWVINLEDLSIIELSQSRYPDKQPSWSPSGLQIAFVRQALNSQIWVMADNGQLQYQFSPKYPVNNLWPSWSSDEQVIFYNQASAGADAVPRLVYLRYEDRFTANETRIPSNPRSDPGPIGQTRPSPDGFWLAYETWPDGTNHDIYMMNTNGSGVTRLTTDRAFDFGPTWRPLAVTPLP